MSRLNLICNGMMLFNELDKDHIQIVIPTITGHTRGYCLDPAPPLPAAATTPAKANVVPLGVGAYQLTGPRSSSRALTDLFDPMGCIVLVKRIVDFDDAGAANVSANITVPKPDMIRLFRGCEPNTGVLGSSGNGALREPDVMNDIAVLCYRDLPAKASLRLFGVDVPTDSAAVFNWILYSNETSMPMPGPGHGGLNDFLSIRGNSTDFVLSNFGSQDAQFDTAIGMNAVHMSMYYELPDTMVGRGPTKTSGPAGCSFLVLADA